MNPPRTTATETFPSIWRDPVFWLVLAMGFVFGAIFNFLPLTFPVFRREFHATLEQMGRTQMLFFMSALVFGAAGGWAAGRFAIRRIVMATVLGLQAGLLVIGNAFNFGMVLVGAFCFGLAVASLAVVCNSIISDHFGGLRQSVFFIWGIVDAVGAIAGPSVFGWWLGRSALADESWRFAYYAATAALAPLLVWTILLRPEHFASHSTQLRAQTPAPISVKSILSTPTIYAIGLAMFLHGVAQVGMVSWVGQVYQKRHGIGVAQAAHFLSANGAGFFAGRSMLTWITSRWRIPELLILGACATSGTLAFVGTIAVGNYWLGLVLFTVAGIFISGDSPSIYSYTGLRFASSPTSAFALLTGIGNIGSAVGPYVAGVIGSRLGIERGIWLMPLFSLSLGILGFAWFLRRRDPPPRLKCGLA